MADLNVLDLSNRVRNRYVDYLLSTHMLGEREAALRAAFEVEVRRSGLLSKGPLLSMLPTYETGASIRDLMARTDRPSLHPSLGALAEGRFDLDMPLYSHQVESIRLAQGGRNVVVATGTGSGKTECFLIPILDEIVSARETGVRAVIVYPMNALANDQVARLRELLRGIPEVTFGRYTGETPQTRADASENDLAAALANERLSREEIQKEPPHILLTNFAMLEYLLIRPKDVDVFRHRAVRYVVLDEAHSYTGAQGIDVSFLIRRVCEGFGSSRVQFFLTSATLAGGSDQSTAESIRRFAETLTGGTFGPEAVIFGTKVSPFNGPETAVPASDLARAFADDAMLTGRTPSPADLARFATEHHLPLPPRRADHASTLHDWMQAWPSIRQMHRMLADRPQSVEELSTALFGNSSETHVRVTETLLTLSIQARQKGSAFPLIPVRFHSFFRGLNGASVCMNGPGHGHAPGELGRLFLEDRRRCEPECNGLALPLASCVQCGLAMFIVREVGGQWAAPPPFDSAIVDGGKTFALSTREAVSDSEDDESPDEKQVCLTCGRIDSIGSLGAACETHYVLRLLSFETEAGNLAKCPRCGAMAGKFDSVLQRFRTGDDAATAVLAEELMRGLPADAEASRLPAGGRRLLAFSDSRQRAAFFAPYLARTSVQSEFEPPLVRAALEAISENQGKPISTEAIVRRFEAQVRQRAYCFVPRQGQDAVIDFDVIPTRQMAQEDWNKVIHEARVRLWTQICRGPRQRKTWYGVGLIATAFDLPDDLVGELATRVDRNSSEVRFLVDELLRHVLSNKAVAFEARPGGIATADLGPGPRVATLHFNLRGDVEGRRRFRWTPYLADPPNPKKSMPAHVVAAFLGTDVVPGVEVASLLDTIWNSLCGWGVLQGFPAGGEYQLPEKRVLIGLPEWWWICSRCGRLAASDLAGRCYLPGCKGHLVRIHRDEVENRYRGHHYRDRLKAAEPFGLVVKEHTAQLENRAGRDYQERFVAGRINVLSTSTTFEMGVDVGGLEAVLLRNVPPTPANYVQRAGRAGRRRSGGAVAVTFCRPLPHDQVHFHQPLQAVAGVVPLPRINLANTRLLQRHLNSFLLGRFLRTLGPEAEWNSVRAFFGERTSEAVLAPAFVRFLDDNLRDLSAAVAGVIPRENSLHPESAVRDARSSLTSGVAVEGVYEPLEEFARQADALLEEIRKPGAEASRLGRAIDSVRAIRESLLKRDLIGFLSDSHWLPSYAFPQDNVRLLVRQQAFTGRMRLERDRELGISEYAPGAEVIADGWLFRSRAVSKRGNAFRVRQYRYCSSCRQLGIADGPVAALCRCGGGRSRAFVEPDGFQTSVLDTVQPPNLFRQRPVPNSEIFLVGGAPPDAFVESSSVSGVWFAHRIAGQLFRANQGVKAQQYRICLTCGSVPEGRSHQTPWGTRCGGTLQALDLGHIFETDTLQLRFGDTWMFPDVRDRIYWRSFSTGFVNAAAMALNIPVRDLGTTYRSQTADSLAGELVLYDRVPGGAGYVQRITSEIALILQALLKNTKDCANPECDPQGSCYICLRSYGNQFEWPDLQRHAIVRVLEPKMAAVGLL